MLSFPSGFLCVRRYWEPHRLPQCIFPMHKKHRSAASGAHRPPDSSFPVRHRAIPDNHIPQKFTWDNVISAVTGILCDPITCFSSVMDTISIGQSTSAADIHYRQTFYFLKPICQKNRYLTHGFPSLSVLFPVSSVSHTL